MVTLREFVQAFRELRLNPSQPVFGQVELLPIGNILGALPSRASGVVSPTSMLPGDDHRYEPARELIQMVGSQGSNRLTA